MNRAGMAIVVGTLFCMSAAARPQAGAQAGAQSSSQASVQAGQTQAQASRQRVGVHFGVGAERSGEWCTGDGFGVQRRAELANRFEKVQAGRRGDGAHDGGSQVRRKNRDSEGFETGGTR